MLDTIKKAKIGSIVPVFQEEEMVDSFDFFSKLSNYGKKKHSLLVDFKDFSVCTAEPALVMTGKGEDFEVTVLSDLGKKIVNLVKKDLSFCEKVKFSKNVLTGIIPKPKLNSSEEQKVKSKSQLDIIRAFAFKFKHVQHECSEYAGLYGCIGSDFIDSFEDLPENKNKNDMPAYVLYLVDTACVVDKKNEKTYFLSNAFVTDAKRDAIHSDCEKKVKALSKVASKAEVKVKKQAKKVLSVSYDTSDDELLSIIKDIKKSIVSGEVVQVNPSRLVTMNHNTEPLTIYQKLRESNGDYSFFMNTEHGVLMGSSSSLHLAVKGDKDKAVEFSTISTARPRGYIGAEIDSDLDNKRSIRIWADEQEMVKHLISIDAARNTVSAVSKSGSTSVKNMFAMKKLESSQYLLSKVIGNLKDQYDAVTALSSVIGFEAGYPSYAASALLRKFENTERGMYGGSFIALSCDGELQTLSSNPLHIKKDSAFFRTGSSIIHSASSDNSDLQRSQSEEEMILTVVKSAGGLK